MEGFKPWPGYEPTVADGGRRSRRELLQGVARLGLSTAGLALLAGCGRLTIGPGQRSAPAAGGPPPETTSLRLDQRPSICVAA